jgi:hypothetical protein
MSMLLFFYLNSTNSVGAKFINIQEDFFGEEYDSGVILGEYINLYYAWAQTNETSLLSIAMYDSYVELGGLAPFHPFFGQRVMIGDDEFFVGNVIAGFELYEDLNANNIFDSIDELSYFIMLNASQQFITTPIEQTFTSEYTRSYTWKYSYMEIDGFLSPFESTSPPWTMRKTIIDSVNLSFAFDVTNETSELKLSIEMGDWDAYEFYHDAENNYQEVRVGDIDLSNNGLSILFGTSISSEVDIDFITTDGANGISGTTLQTNENRIFDLGFGDDYDLGINGSAMPSYTSVADPSTLYEEQVMGWGAPQVLLDWWSTSFPSISELPSIPPLGVDDVSFLYRICYPEWGGVPFHHDPRYKAYFTDIEPVDTSSTTTTSTTDTSTTSTSSSTTSIQFTTPGFLILSSTLISIVLGKKRLQGRKY